jgi:hypothetical protein
MSREENNMIEPVIECVPLGKRSPGRPWENVVRFTVKEDLK